MVLFKCFSLLKFFRDALEISIKRFIHIVSFVSLAVISRSRLLMVATLRLLGFINLKSVICTEWPIEMIKWVLRCLLVLVFFFTKLFRIRVIIFSCAAFTLFRYLSDNLWRLATLLFLIAMHFSNSKVIILRRINGFIIRTSTTRHSSWLTNYSFLFGVAIKQVSCGSDFYRRFCSLII